MEAKIPSKADRRRMLKLATTVLVHRHNGHIKHEQSAWIRLDDFVGQFGLDAGTVIEQAIAYLKRTSISASMNGLV